MGDIRLEKAPSKSLSDALRVIQRSDVGFGNLEAPFTRTGEPAQKWAVLKQEPNLATEYVRMGFKVVNIANNHMLDYGVEGLLSTLERLDAAGIRRVGGGKTISESLDYALIEEKGVTMAFLGCASTLPGDSVAGRRKPGLAPIRVRTTYHFDPEMEKEGPGGPPVIFTQAVGEDLRAVKRRIRKAKGEADYVVVAAHWGMAYQDYLMDYQREVGRDLVTAGADLVVGHHPHRLQAIERYKGGVILHSLGNFYFEMPKGKRRNTRWVHWPPRYGGWSQSNESMMVKTVVDGKGDASHELIPTVRVDGGQPEIAGRNQAEKILRHVEFLSSEFGTKLALRDGRALID